MLGLSGRRFRVTHEELTRSLLAERFTPHTRGTEEPDDAAAVARRVRALLENDGPPEDEDGGTR